MGDPGLHSKFVEMQQEEFLTESDVNTNPVNPRLRGLLLDRSRILDQLSRATHGNYITLLRRSLQAIEKQIERI